MLQPSCMSICKKRKTQASSSYDFLHSKNPFKGREIDFVKLSQSTPGVLNHIIRLGNNKLSFDWKNQNAVKELTNAMLSEEFGITLLIPDNHLCPPIPNRINYLCWLSDLLDDSRSASVVCDIGVGPLCIYPILGYKLFGWKFFGSDIDQEAIDCSESNLSLYPEFADNIEIFLVSDCEKVQKLVLTDLTANDEHRPLQCRITSSASFPQGPVQILLQHVPSNVTVNAVMTNPPFYDLDEEIKMNSHSVCTGSLHEMKTYGGEVAFVGAMILDSLMLRDRICWYTSMIGKKSSLNTLSKALLNEGISPNHIFTTEFKQGMTTRWGLAWTFNSSAAAAYRTFKVSVFECEVCLLLRCDFHLLDEKLESFEFEVTCSIQHFQDTRLAFETVVDEPDVCQRIVDVVKDTHEKVKVVRFTNIDNITDKCIVLWMTDSHSFAIGNLNYSVEVTLNTIKVKFKFEPSDTRLTRVDKGLFKSTIQSIRTNIENEFLRTSRHWRRRLANDKMNV